MSPLTCFLVVAACLLIQAFFAGMEMALVSSNRLRLLHLTEKGSRRARIITTLLKTPEKVLATTLVGINVVLILGASVASYFFSDVLEMGPRGAAVATAVMVPLILIFAEITPKTLSRPRATQVALALIYPLRLAQIVIYPLVQAMSWITGHIVRLLGVKSGQTRMFASIEDFLLLMKEGQKQGILSTEERKMISRVFDFGRIKVSEIMVPISEVVSAPESATVKDLWEIIGRCAYSRIPVYRERKEEIVGTVKANDLIMADPAENIAMFVRPAFFVPENKILDDLLEEMRRNSATMAVVVDQNEKALGIVTRENILEEIVGDIHDEYDLDEASSFRLKGEAAEVSGRMRIAELNELLELALPHEGSETLAGFVVGLLGRIPAPGEKFTHAGHQFAVMEASPRRVIRMEIRGPAVQKKAAVQAGKNAQALA
jgi:putative hemolysin